MAVMHKIGIDPGLTGALALFAPGDDRVLALDDMPVSQKLSGKGQQVNAPGVRRLLESYVARARGGPVSVLVERVAAMPGEGKRKMGATSAFSFGFGAGIVEGVVCALGLPYAYVYPQTWKSRAGLLRKPKEAALTLAQQLYPDVGHMLTRKRDVGRADAILIARFGAESDMGLGELLR